MSISFRIVLNVHWRV